MQQVLGQTKYLSVSVVLIQISTGTNKVFYCISSTSEILFCDDRTALRLYIRLVSAVVQLISYCKKVQFTNNWNLWTIFFLQFNNNTSKLLYVCVHLYLFDFLYVCTSVFVCLFICFQYRNFLMINFSYFHIIYITNRMHFGAS